MRPDCLVPYLWNALMASVCAFGVLGSAGHAAAQERERQAQPAAPTAPDPNGSVQFFAGTQGGFDTNLDNRFQSRASPFEMLQLGASGAYKPTDSSAYSFYVSGRDFWYNNLALSQRYDIDTAVGARFDFSPTTALKLGGSYYKDAISLDRYDIFKGFADLVNEGETYRFRLKLDSRTEVSTNERPSGSLAPDVLAATRNSAFDFTKNGATASVLMMRNQMIAPFIMGSYSDVDYFHQAPDPLINRSARDYWGTAGARVALNPDVSFDLGARYNHRDFADQTVTQFSSSYLDARLTWRAYDGLTLRGIVERQIKEPTTSFGLADDVTTYEAAFDRRLASWSIRGRVWLDHVRPIGDPLDYYKYNWSLGVGYDLAKNTELFAEYFGRHVTEKVNDVTYERTRLGAGIRMTF